MVWWLTREWIQMRSAEIELIVKYILKNYATVGVLLLLVVGACQERKMHIIGNMDS